MCQFFSCISNGKGKIWYFDADMRQAIRAGKYNYQEDSHSSIAEFYKSEIKEDRANKYEYDPLSGRFTVDQINAKDGEGFVLNDAEAVEAKCRALDFTTVVPNWDYVQDLTKRLRDYKPKNLIIATKMPPIKKLRGVLDQVRDLVWNQVGDQVRDLVRDQVRNQVGDQVRDLVWDQVRDLVWNQVRNQVRDQVRDQVRNQVRDQVWNQVWICAYFAVKLFMSLSFEHPAFDLIRLGIIVVNVVGKFKVFGKNGKFLGEFDEKEETNDSKHR